MGDGRVYIYCILLIYTNNGDYIFTKVTIIIHIGNGKYEKQDIIFPGKVTTVEGGYCAKFDDYMGDKLGETKYDSSRLLTHSFCRFRKGHNLIF